MLIESSVAEPAFIIIIISAKGNFSICRNYSCDYISKKLKLTVVSRCFPNNGFGRNYLVEFQMFNSCENWWMVIMKKNHKPVRSEVREICTPEFFKTRDEVLHCLWGFRGVYIRGKFMLSGNIMGKYRYQKIYW